MTADQPTIVATSVGFRRMGLGDWDWVAGGSVANLLSLWQTHQLGPVLAECWHAGVVLTGVSAGSLCWFTGGTTDSFGLPLRPVTNGLGFLPYANSPHHDAEPERRPVIRRLIAEQRLTECYATDNGAALTFFGTTLHETISDTEGALGWHLTRNQAGTVDEQPLPTRVLPITSRPNSRTPRGAGRACWRWTAAAILIWAFERHLTPACLPAQVRRAAHSRSRIDIITSSYHRPSCQIDSRRRPSSTKPAFSYARTPAALNGATSSWMRCRPISRKP